MSFVTEGLGSVVVILNVLLTRSLSAFRAGVAGALLLVVGCAVRQPPQPAMPASVDVPDRWGAQSEASPDVPTAWLSEFGDPRLETSVNRR